MAASRWWRMSSSHSRGRAGRSGGAASLRRRLPLGVRASSSASQPAAACSAHWPCDAGDAAGEAAGEADADADAAPCNRRASGDRFTGPRRSWRALAGLRGGAGRQMRPRRGRNGANEARGGVRRGVAAVTVRASTPCSAQLRLLARNRRSSRWGWTLPRRGGAAGHKAASERASRRRKVASAPAESRWWPRSAGAAPGSTAPRARRRRGPRRGCTGRAAGVSAAQTRHASRAIVKVWEPLAPARTRTAPATLRGRRVRTGPRRCRPGRGAPACAQAARPRRRQEPNGEGWHQASEKAAAGESARAAARCWGSQTQRRGWPPPASRSQRPRAAQLH